MDDNNFNIGIETNPEVETKVPPELPILPLRDTVAFPNIVTPLVVAREKSVKLINDVIAGSRILGLVAQKNGEIEDPGLEDIYNVGTAAIILRMLKFPHPGHHAMSTVSLKSNTEFMKISHFLFYTFFNFFNNFFYGKRHTVIFQYTIIKYMTCL